MKKGQKFVVFGGAGFIGSWVVDYILKDFGEEVGQIVILDNFTRGTRLNLYEALKSGKVKVIKGSICDTALVHKLVKGADYVINEAAIRITHCAEDPRLCNEVLVDGMFNIFEACAKYNVKKLVFNSSASVYGNPSYIPMDEEHPYNNDTFYGAAKIANEHMARAFRRAYGMNYICLRPFNVYGPRMDVFGVYTEVLIRWLDCIMQNTPPIIHGDGKQSLDFIYVEDVAYATVQALKSSANEGVFNIGTGKETSLNQLVKLLLKLTGSNLKPVYYPQRAVAHVSRRKASVKKINKELGVIISTSIEDGLRKLISWHVAIKQLKRSSYHGNSINQAVL